MRPSPRLVWVCLLLLCLSLVFATFGLSQTVFSIGAVLFLLVLISDAIFLMRRELPVVQRQLPQIVPVNRDFEGSIQLHHRGVGTVEGELVEQCPQGIGCNAGSAFIKLSNKAHNLSFEYNARQRGTIQWQFVQWTGYSKLNLWHRRSLLPCQSKLAVYPDYAASRRQLNISLSRSLHELGIVQRQRVGDSQEFHQLRAYQQGDSLRQVDWKATSRRRELVTRQYAEESNQSLVLMLDCGRRMRLRHGDRELLDEAMDATLMAAEVALRQGDRVSVQCFAAEPFYWSGIARTARSISTMLSQLHDIQSRPEASDYVAAAQALRQSLKQRSTVIVVTHSRNENMDELNMAARLLCDKHNVVVADISDAELGRVLEEAPEDFDKALSYVGALEYRAKRQSAQRNLRKLGTDVLDVGPNQLVSALVRAYHSHRGMAA